MSEPFAPLDPEEKAGEKTAISGLHLTIVALALGGFLLVPALGLFRSGKKTAERTNIPHKTGIQEHLQMGGKAVPPVLNPPSTHQSRGGQDERVSVDETLAGMGKPPSTLPETLKNGVSPEPAAKKMPFLERRLKHAVLPMENASQVAQPRVTREIPVHEPNEREISAKTPGVKPETKPAADPPVHTIIVQPGDTLYGISRRVGATPAEIVAWNGINPGSPVEPGQVLKVPGVAPATEQTPVIEIPRGEFPQPLAGAVVGASVYPPSVLPFPSEPLALPRETKPLDPREPSAE